MHDLNHEEDNIYRVAGDCCSGRDMRCTRGCEMQGYPSRLHYISDWVVDNTARGNIREVTNRIPVYKDMVKSINFMTKNRDKYAALADSATVVSGKELTDGLILTFPDKRSSKLLSYKPLQ